MRIVSVNCSLDESLRQCGHEVFSVSLERGLHALRAVAGLDAFAPDCIVQQEHLGYVVVLSDLPSFSCVKAFWSLDTHINLYWHRHYGRLFDVFFTPHMAFCAKAPPHWQHPNMCRLPAAGFEYPWKAHADRSRSLSFVGRFTTHRPSRKALAEFLHQRYAMQAQEDISYAQMLQIYADTRILPNETIAFETNFRLLEGAGCGCCVLSPDIGEDQNVLLEPGREMLVYADALECRELADFCLRKPVVAEKIGNMARQRILAEHLPQHRAVQMLQAVQDAPRVAMSGTQASECLWYSLSELTELKDENSDFPDFCQWKNDASDTLFSWVIRARRARKMCDNDGCAVALREALRGFPAALRAAGADTATAACLAEAATDLGLVCLHGGNELLARECWHLFQQCSGKILPAAESSHFAATPTTSGVSETLGTSGTATAPLRALALEWAGHLYPAGKHWYQALEMVSFVSGQDAIDGAWAQALLQLGPVVHHFPQLALSARARLSLNEPGNPLLCAAYIAENIRVFRVREAQDEVQNFMRAVAGSPAEAVFWQALRKECKSISGLLTAHQPFSFS